MIPTDTTQVNKKIHTGYSGQPRKHLALRPDLLSLSAKSRRAKPLSKLQYVLLIIMIEDCRAQEFSNRKVTELAQMSGYSVRGVVEAIANLMSLGFIVSKKQTRGRATVRAVTRLGFAYSPAKFRKNNKSASQSASQTRATLYKISYSEDQDQTDLLERDKINQMTKREEECFKAIGFSIEDEIIILNRIKRSQLSPEARLKLATTVLARHYKIAIKSPRAYYLTAIANHRDC